MAFKASSGKSNGIHAMNLRHPSNFFEGNVVEPVVLVDAMQMFFAVREGETGYDLARRFSWKTKSLLREGARIVVYCFDRQAHVPVAKGAEQRLRDDAKERVEEANEIVEKPKGHVSFLDDPEPRLDARLPNDFVSGLKDRSGYRRNVIRFVCAQILCGSDERLRIEPIADQSVVVSGHCMSREDLLGLVETSEDLGVSSEVRSDAEGVPIVLRRDALEYLPRLAHSVGEAEMQFFHFLRLRRYLGAGSEEGVAISSTDTDVLFLGLVYLWKCAHAWGEEPPEAMKWIRSPSSHVDVLKLWNEAGPEKTLQYVAAQALAGTDYTQGWMKVTHQRVFETIIEKGDEIGPMIVDPLKGVTDREAYLRLTVASWIRARVPSEKLPSSPEDGDWHALAERAREYSGRFLPPYRFPGPNSSALKNRALRWSYYLNYMFMTGERETNLPDPGEWGFGPGTESITHGNAFPLS